MSNDFIDRSRGIAGVIMGCALAAACTALRAPVPQELQALQAQRLAESSKELSQLDDVDAQLWLDNDVLGAAMLGGLNRVAASGDDTTLADVSIEFQPQLIALRATARIPDEGGAGREHAVVGQIALEHRDGELVWWPRFVRSGRLNRVLAERLAAAAANRIDIGVMPPGILEAGARLTAGTEVVASLSRDLHGLFVTSGAGFLIEPDATRLALDLAYIPGVTQCEGTLQVSRSGFASAVRQREPVPVGDGQGVEAYFMEFTGASETTSVLHYWFADGVEAGVQELEIEPSERWRTWSVRPPDVDARRDWRVYVVESGTGCLLESSGFGLAPEHDQPPVDGAPAFETYRASFGRKTDGFPQRASLQGIGAVDVRRPFVIRVLNESLSDVRLGTRLALESTEPVELTAGMAAFDAETLQCEARECDIARECTVQYDNCPVERDTRDCLVCELRNPLNNRCLSEVEDPACLATREERNARLEAERETCIEGERQVRVACEALKAQEVERCRADAAGDLQACQAERGRLVQLENSAAPIAAVTADVDTRGGVEVKFTRFRLEENLQRLHMDVGLSAELALSGQIRFSPGPPLRETGSCIEGWKGPFKAFAVLPQWRGGLTGPLRLDRQGLTTDWSGLTHRLDLHPTPLVSLFNGDPRLLAGCHVGLGVDDVAQALSGDGVPQLTGELALSIRPLPTRLLLLPAWITIAGETHTGEPDLGDRFLSFEIGE